MPKITRHGGPSDRADIEPEPEAPDAEGGEQPSAGTSTETSSEKPPTSTEPSDPAPRKRARSVGSRSRQGRKDQGSSTAGLTDTSGPETDAADG